MTFTDLLLSCGITFEVFEKAVDTGILILLIGTITYALIARLITHPLASVPGPRLAALTSWYEFYYDVLLGGKYVQRIETLHNECHSPIVRTGPNQVHVNDPQVYKRVFGVASNYIKSPFFYTSAGLPEAIGGIIDRKAHHVRRSILGPRFAPKVIASYEPGLVKLVRKCTDIMARKAKTTQSKGIAMPRYTRALTVDVISEFTFGRTMGLVNEEDEMPELLVDLSMFTAQFHIVKHFPIYRRMLSSMPDAISKKFMPGFFQFRERAKDSVDALIAEKDAGLRKNHHPDSGTVLDLLLTRNPKKNHEIPGPTALVDEGCAFIVGGSDTTGHTMESATYLVLSNKEILQTLRKELDNASPYIKDDFDLSRVLQLPFLSAVIKESLRLFTPVPSPLPRTVPDGGITVDGHFLPEGTILTHSLYLIHHNPKLFASPKTFNPFRWLGESGKQLEQYYVPFSKGSRSCIGIDLAYHEMYTFLATLFSRFDMEVVNTGKEDMEWADYMFAKRKGEVRVRITRDRWGGDLV
ncbi:cytochrome P450 [Aspergillus californicus]